MLKKFQFFLFPSFFLILRRKPKKRERKSRKLFIMHYLKLRSRLFPCLRAGESKFQVRIFNILESNKKILFLDLDETLIRSVYGTKKAENNFVVDGIEFNFVVRPFCQYFLKKMSNLFDIYIFTAGTKEYAHPIIEYLNKDITAIKGILHRGHCLKTKNGVYIKDLRIIKGKGIEEMVLVDNNIKSFSFQLENGIPVQSFYGNAKDRILLKLASFLKKLAAIENIPAYLNEALNLRACFSEMT